MKKIITIGLMLLAGLVAKSQIEYVYGYDANGNRISRVEIELKISQDTTASDSTAIITDSTTATTINQANQQQQQYEAMLGEQKITIYPNPTKGELQIDITNFATGSKGLILVTDMQGRILINNENISSSNTVNLSSVANGNYILKVAIEGKYNEWVVAKE